MADLLSPGVKVTRADMSQVVAVEGDSAAVFAGDFEKGPIGSHTLISSVQEFRENFGYPNVKNYNDYYQVQNFLAYSGAIYVSRAADLNGTPTQVKNLVFEENAFKTQTNAFPVENINVISNDSVDVKFDKNDKLQVGDVIRFGDSAKEYKVKYIRDIQVQVPNPDYKPLTELVVDLREETIRVGDVISYVIQTNADSYEIEAENPGIVLINKSLKSITALNPGFTIINIRATKEGCRENRAQIAINVAAKENTSLIVSPMSLTITVGETGLLDIETDADDYTIESSDTRVAEIAGNKQTVNALKVGQCQITIRAEALNKEPVEKVVDVNVIEKTVVPEPEKAVNVDLDTVSENSEVVFRDQDKILELQADADNIQVVNKTPDVIEISEV